MPHPGCRQATLCATTMHSLLTSCLCLHACTTLPVHIHTSVFMPSAHSPSITAHIHYSLSLIAHPSPCALAPHPLAQPPSPPPCVPPRFRCSSVLFTSSASPTTFPPSAPSLLPAQGHTSHIHPFPSASPPNIAPCHYYLPSHHLPLPPHTLGTHLPLNALSLMHAYCTILSDMPP